MVCLTPKSSQKISEIIGVSLWPPSNSDHNPLDYVIWGVLEKKTNGTSDPNIDSLKTAIKVWFLWHINLCGLFNTKAILLEEQQWRYLTQSWMDKEVHTFAKGIC